MLLRFSILLILLLTSHPLLFPNLLSEEKRELTLKESITLSRNNDSELMKLSYERRAKESEYNQSIINFAPTITSEVTKSNTADILNNPQGVTIFSIYNTINQPLYNRVNIYKWKKAGDELIYNKLSIQKRLNDLCKEISSLYFSGLNKKYAALIRKNEVEKAKEDYTAIRGKIKGERAIPLDLLLQESYILESENEFYSADKEYERERLQLIRKLNLGNDIDLKEPDQFHMNEPTLEEALRLAHSYRIDIKVSEMLSRIKKDKYEIERSIIYPKVDLYADQRLTKRQNSEDQIDWSVFLKVSMNLSDDVKLEGQGGLRKYNYLEDVVDEQKGKVTFNNGSSNRVIKAQNKAEYKYSKVELRDIKIQAEEEVTENYHKMIYQKNKVKLARLNLEIGNRIAEKTRRVAGGGRANMEDFIEARRKYIRYQLEYRQAIFEYRLSVINLKWAIGTLYQDIYMSEGLN